MSRFFDGNKFSGTLSVVDIGYANCRANRDFSIAIWHYVTGSATGDGQCFVGSGQYGYEWRIDAATGKQEFLNSQVVSLAMSSSAVVGSAWHHSGFSLPSSNLLTFYKDGVADGTTDIGSTVINGGGYNVGIGKDGGSGAATDIYGGHLAYMAYYNAVLNASQWAALGRGVAPWKIRWDALVGCYPLFGRDTLEVDYSSNRAFGTPSANAVAYPAVMPPVSVIRASSLFSSPGSGPGGGGGGGGSSNAGGSRIFGGY